MCRSGIQSMWHLVAKIGVSQDGYYHDVNVRTIESNCYAPSSFYRREIETLEDPDHGQHKLFALLACPDHSFCDSLELLKADGAELWIIQLMRALKSKISLLQCSTLRLRFPRSRSGCPGCSCCVTRVPDSALYDDQF
jgi:hypothetical protein